MAGGVALNCVANGRVLRDGAFGFRRTAEHFERACVLLPKDPVARTNLAAFQQQLALRG